jgi:hypothetical protein
MKKVIKLPNDIFLLDDGYWLWFSSKDYFEELKSKREGKLSEEITGKYLFFHENPKVLAEIAVAEIRGGGFHLVKVNQKIMGAGKDHVLCLYFKDDSQKDELAERYQDKNGIKYRYWKSNDDTRKGKYSKQFLDSLKSK